MAVSAQSEALAAPPVQHIQPEQSALAHVASTMPVIGVPEAEPSADVPARLAVELPHDVAAEPSEPSATATARRETMARPAAPLAVDASTPTWLRNAVATLPADGRPEIAVVIDDLGLNRTLDGGAQSPQGTLDPGLHAVCGSSRAADRRPRTPPAMSFWCTCRWSRPGTTGPDPMPC